jgi:hypothetical protein
MVSGFGMDFGVDPVLGALQRAGFKVCDRGTWISRTLTQSNGDIQMQREVGLGYAIHMWI